MKKSYLTLGAVAAIMASCTNEVLIDQVETSEVEIGFATFANKVTKAENSEKDYTLDLNGHHENFAVWGYKNTEADKVFNNQLVEWSSTETKWGYTPVRFWDKAATTYEFYAAAPKTDENGATVAWVFNGDDNVDDNAHYFSLAGVTLVGSNLSNQSSVKTDYEPSFLNAPKVGQGDDAKQDIDYMIADKKSVGKTAFTSTAVELDFIHILSRLNVTVKKVNTGDAVVTLKSLEVVNLNSKGDFDESKAAADATKKTARWYNQSTTYTINAIKEYTVTTTAAYVLQSLVIPQETAVEKVALDGTAADGAVAIADGSKPYIKIVYTIDPDGDGDVPAEKYTAYYNLATVFGVSGYDNGTILTSETSLDGYYTKSGDVYTACAAGTKADGSSTYYKPNTLAFNEGWQNLLNITIDPVEIKFTGKVALWDDDLTKDLTVIKND